MLNNVAEETQLNWPVSSRTLSSVLTVLVAAFHRALEQVLHDGAGS